jgi:CDP-diacylglycerol pyrophosphatase
MSSLARRISVALGCLLVACVAGAAAAQDQTACPTITPPHDIIGKIADACSFGCLETDLAHRYAILKDNSAVKRAAYLVVARDCRATGIEAAAVLVTTPLVDVWAYAWFEAEKWLEPSPETGITTAPAWVGLEVNAGNVDAAGRDLSRSMDRLHIHMACVRPDVIDALRAMRGETATMHFPEASGIDFTVVKTASLFGPSSPFALLPADRSAWRNRTIAVFGQRNTSTYYVAIGTGSPDHEISAEDLLDQMCALPA